MSDARLDAQLRNVPVPDGLLDRLHGVADEWTDDRVDVALCNVPLPEGFFERLERCGPRRRTMRWRQLALAASIVLAFGLWNAGAVAVVALSFQGIGAPGRQDLL